MVRPGMSGTRSRRRLFLLSSGRVHCFSIARFIPVLRLVLQSNPVCMRIFNAYGALLCPLIERKTERELARARISVVFRYNMKSSNKCAKNVLVLYMYKYGPLCSLHGHGAWRLFFFGIFMVDIHVHFLKASADFQKTYGGQRRKPGRGAYDCENLEEVHMTLKTWKRCI